MNTFGKYVYILLLSQDILILYLFSNIPEVCLISVKPSLVATACIAAARQTLQLCPKWTGILQNVTGYQFMDLLPCVSVLIR